MSIQRLVIIMFIIGIISVGTPNMAAGNTPGVLFSPLVAAPGTVRTVTITMVSASTIGDDIRLYEPVPLTDQLFPATCPSGLLPGAGSGTGSVWELRRGVTKVTYTGGVGSTLVFDTSTTPTVTPGAGAAILPASGVFSWADVTVNAAPVSTSKMGAYAVATCGTEGGAGYVGTGTFTSKKLVGGEVLSTDTMALFIGAAQANALVVLASLAAVGAGITFLTIKRK